MRSEIANYSYCLREKVPRTRAQIWASHPVAGEPLRDITQWGRLSSMSSSRRLSLLCTPQERRSVVASWSSQTGDLVVVKTPEEMYMIRQARIATMQYIEPTNRPRPHRRRQILQRQKLSHSPLRPTRPRRAPLSLSCLWSPARTSLRSEIRPNSPQRDEIWKEGQSDLPYWLVERESEAPRTGRVYY